MEVVASLSQGRTAVAQCGLFTHKSVPVIFEPPYITIEKRRKLENKICYLLRVCLSIRAFFCFSVPPSAWNNYAPARLMLIKLDICIFFRKRVEEVQDSLKTNNNNTG